MADTPYRAPLVELPYGTRQRIVVVPDDVLEAENDPGTAGDRDQPRRPWGVQRGDPRHPALKALKEADDDGLRLLPVRQSHVGQLDMPIGHPLPPNVVHIGSRRDRSVVFEAELVPATMPAVPDGLVWFNHEPTWQAVAEGRASYGLREFQLQVASREDFGISADVASKIRQRKVLSLGGGFTQQVDTSWLLEGTFGEAPKRGWRRGG